MHPECIQALEWRWYEIFYKEIWRPNEYSQLQKNESVSANQRDLQQLG